MPGPPTPLRKLSPQTPKPYATGGFEHWFPDRANRTPPRTRFRLSTTTHPMLPIRNTKPFGTQNHMADIAVAGFARIQTIRGKD